MLKLDILHSPSTFRERHINTNGCTTLLQRLPVTQGLHKAHCLACKLTGCHFVEVLDISERHSILINLLFCQWCSFYPFSNF